MLDKLIEKDYQLLVYINQTGSIPWDSFWLLVTNAWNWIPFFLLILWVNFYFFPKKEAWKIFGYTLGVLFVTIFITNGTKELVARLRPLHTLELIPQLRIILTEKGYSFFSGHTSNSFAICTFLYWVFRTRLRVAFWLFLWPVPYAYSRMYLGVHFPTDILVGILVGLSTGSIGYKIYKKYYLKDTSKIEKEAI
jgi:PAP2 family protein